MSWFGWLTLAGWASVLVAAAFVRGRTFTMFVGILVGIYSLVAVELATTFGRALPVYAALHVTVYVNFAVLARPRMRPLVYRLLVSWPSALCAAGTLLGLPWAVLLAVGLHPWGTWVPFVLAAIGVGQSLTTKREVHDLVAHGPSGARADKLAPHPHGTSRTPRPLRIVQITDPHIGPFMSVARLRRIAERAVNASPDLVFLTGDFLTMESHDDADLLLRALEPLRAMPGRVFACRGNHDHEAPTVVARAMAENAIELLIDDARVVETEAGPVQVVGMDFAFRNREERMKAVCAAHPRIAGALRLVLLHDPGAFKHLPEGEGDLVFSGHTHGGQLGLLSLGASWTILRLFGHRIPDHGFWARGTDRLYVHRGTGHYGFPLRLGVPAEESVLRIHANSGERHSVT